MMRSNGEKIFYNHIWTRFVTIKEYISSIFQLYKKRKIIYNFPAHSVLKTKENPHKWKKKVKKTKAK